LLHIVTVATDTRNEHFRNYLKRSCDYFSSELRVLGEGQKWSGFQMKDRLLLEFLRTLKSNDIILFTDAYDAMLMSGASEIEARFREFQHPLVFSCEKRCWPRADRARHFPNSSPWRFLNSGGFIGHAGYIRELLDRHRAQDLLGGQYQWSNQAYWIEVYCRDPQAIVLDSQCVIFQTLAYTDFLTELEFVGGRWKNRITGTFPSHLHFNGKEGERFLRLVAKSWAPWKSESLNAWDRIRIHLDSWRLRFLPRWTREPSA
jgi:hypothetical protein